MDAAERERQLQEDGALGGGFPADVPYSGAGVRSEGRGAEPLETEVGEAAHRGPRASVWHCDCLQCEKEVLSLKEENSRVRNRTEELQAQIFKLRSELDSANANHEVRVGGGRR